MIAGQSGYGKSATVKQLFSRQVDFGVHIANIDYEPLPGDGKRGEYSIVAEAVGGVNYLISNYSDSQLNFFEISDEYEYNRATGEEIPTLYLEEKIVDMTNILMVLATSFTTNGMVGEFEPTEYSRIKSIISKNVRKIYADCGLGIRMQRLFMKRCQHPEDPLGQGGERSGCPRCMIFIVQYYWMRGRIRTVSRKTRSPSCWIYLRIACVKCIAVLIA